jgi:hypothetical protein
MLVIAMLTSYAVACIWFIPWAIDDIKKASANTITGRKGA